MPAPGEVQGAESAENAFNGHDVDDRYPFNYKRHDAADVDRYDRDVQRYDVHDIDRHDFNVERYNISDVD